MSVGTIVFWLACVLIGLDGALIVTYRLLHLDTFWNVQSFWGKGDPVVRAMRRNPEKYSRRAILLESALELPFFLCFAGMGLFKLVTG